MKFYIIAMTTECRSINRWISMFTYDAINKLWRQKDGSGRREIIFFKMI